LWGLDGWLLGVLDDLIAFDEDVLEEDFLFVGV